MALTLAELYASPDHYLHSFDGDDALFVPMDRAAYARSIFLDARISPAAERTLRVPLAVLELPTGKPAPTRWIYHVAHCGSTLLARALDVLDDTLVLREPLALRQAALAPEPNRLALVLAMLGKRYDPPKPTLVKANVPVNFILPQIARFDPEAKAIFLHTRLPDYLLAILRGENHRQWVRTITAELGSRLGGGSADRDAERAAALWLAQIRRFAAAIEAMPNARSLDAEDFFTQPRACLGAAARHFEISATEAELDAVVAGPLFSTYSKNPGVAFDNAARMARKQALEASLGEELELARTWAESAAPDLAQTLAAIGGASLLD